MDVPSVCLWIMKTAHLISLQQIHLAMNEKRAKIKLYSIHYTFDHFFQFAYGCIVFGIGEDGGFLSSDHQKHILHYQMKIKMERIAIKTIECSICMVFANDQLTKRMQNDSLIRLKIKRV